MTVFFARTSPKIISQAAAGTPGEIRFDEICRTARLVSGNRDDHTKNFAFMMKPNGEWTNTPAYDITFNQGIAGEHNMTIAGKGKDVTLDDLMAVGEHASLSRENILSLLDQVRYGTSQFSELAKDYGLPGALSKQISTYISKQVDSISP